MKRAKLQLAAWLAAALCLITPITIGMPVPEGGSDNYGVARWVDSGLDLHSQKATAAL